jgi:acetyltransferase-like isoleucine patch superfamily enzyme
MKSSLFKYLGSLLWIFKKIKDNQRISGIIKKGYYYMYLSAFKWMGKNVTIHPSVYIRNPEGISIGDNSNINHGCELYGAGGIKIGNGTLIAYRVTIMSDSRTFKGVMPLKERAERIKKPVEIGDDVWIGTGAIIMPGTIIKNHAIIAAGAVVTKNVEEWDIVGGNPARKISSRLDG